MSIEKNENYEVPSQNIEMESFRVLVSHTESYVNTLLENSGSIFDRNMILWTIMNDWYSKIPFPNSIQIQTSGRYFSIKYIDTNKESQEICYDILWKQEDIITPWTIQEALHEANEKLESEIDIFEGQLSLMQWIFERNSEESYWDFKAGEWDIGDEDIVNEWEFAWKHLNEVQAQARQNMREIWKIQQGDYSISPKQKIRLRRLEEQYLHMTLWIWDLYQWWGRAFAVNEENTKLWAGRNTLEVSILVRNMIIERAPNIEWEDGIFAYYYHVHSLMNEWYAPDRTNTLVHTKFSEVLNNQIYRYLITEQENNPDKQEYCDTLLVEFARMVSGRGTKKSYSWHQDEIYTVAGYEWTTWNKDTSLSMHEDLYDLELANEIMIHIMTRPWGFLEKLYNSENIIIEDPEVGDETPSNIVSWAVEILQTSLVTIERDNSWNETARSELSYTWAQDYISQIAWNLNIALACNNYPDYKSLPLDLKVQISAVARLKKKLETNQRKLKASWWHARRWAKEFTNENFWEVLEEIIKNAFDDTIESINSNFSFKWNDWNGVDSENLKNFTDTDWDKLKFTQSELDMFDLLHDTKGFGFLNFTDTNQWYTLTWAKIAWMLALAFALTAATGWVAGALWAKSLAATMSWNQVLQWGMMWLYAAPTSWVIFPEWHSSTKEMLYDRASDVPISIITGMVWWVVAWWMWSVWKKLWLAETSTLVTWIWVPWAKLLSRWGLKNWWIFWADLYLLWIKTEQWRNMQLTEYFHSDTIMSDF